MYIIIYRVTKYQVLLTILMLKKNYNTSKTLIIYAPFIDIGGIEKNLVILTNYLTKNISKLTLVTWRKKDKKLFNKKVKIVNPGIFFPKLIIDILKIS